MNQLLQEPTQDGSQRTWFGNVYSAIRSTASGMGVTLRHLFSKPVTLQYPEERPIVDDRYRGVHYLEQDLCIYCDACAKACPIDCIDMEAVRHGKELEWKTFTVDYQKCMHCELCVYPCPKDCIHLGQEITHLAEDRSDLVHELLSYTGLTEEQKVRIAEAEAKKAAKKAALAAKKATEVKELTEAEDPAETQDAVETENPEEEQKDG